MQPLLEHRLTLGEFETRVLELEGTGTPILFLHGYADSADTWRNALDLLARQGRRALAVDLPGFGAASELSHDEPILTQLDRFAAAAVRHLAGAGHAAAGGVDGGRAGGESGAGGGVGGVGGGVVVAGNSLGGCVALRLGERSDLPVIGVCPVAPAGLDMPRWFNAIERDPIVRTLLAIPFPLPEPIVRTAVGEAYRNLAFARPRAVTREVVRSFTSHHRDRVTIRRYLNTAQRMLPELRDPFRLSAVGVPVLLVWGDRDRMVTHRGSRRVIEALPNTTYELITGCGHCPQVEEPHRFVKALLRFVDSLAEAQTMRRPA